MLSDLELYVVLTAIACATFWIIPASLPNWRIGFLAAFSALFVFLVSPGGFVGVTFLVGLVIGSQRILPRKRKAILFPCIALALVPIVASRVFGDFGLLFTFGIAFTTVKAIGLIIESHARKIRHAPTSVALFIYFFPLFTIGPVEQIEKFQRERIPSVLDNELFFNGLLRIIGGLFLVDFICRKLINGMLSAPRFAETADFAHMDAATAWAFVALKFLYTYLNFVGFSEVAIGTSALFGFKIIENFNRPLFATNIQEFWRRYHISMGNWITRYLFFPIVGWLKKSWSNYVATFFAFVTFGAWHAFTPNYVYWGVMHGLALAGYHAYRRHLMPTMLKQPIAVQTSQKIVGCIVTISYVAYLQTFANLQTFAGGISLTQRLFGM